MIRLTNGQRLSGAALGVALLCWPLSSVAHVPCATDPDGTPCDDDNACTWNETCQAGTCIAANSVVCAAKDPCHAAGLCDPATGACSSPAQPDGIRCDDSNGCTTVDKCQAGRCVGTEPVVCTATDPCHAPGLCRPETGACSNPTRAAGTPCDDGDPFTTDRCLAGACVGVDVDECAIDNGGCDAAHACVNNDRAAPGCIDLNECLTDNGACGDFATCSNNDGAEPGCIDIDECAVGNGGCGAFRACVNKYKAAGVCVDIDECAEGRGGCDGFHSCVNNDGAPPACVDLDECLTDNGGCGAFKTCSNNDGAGPDCIDIDECTLENGGCGDAAEVRCVNRDGEAPACRPVSGCEGGCASMEASSLGLMLLVLVRARRRVRPAQSGAPGAGGKREALG